MRIDVSFLPALAATFMLVFARIGTMVMLMPGLGEVNVPVRIRLGDGAGADRSCILPLHRAAYQVDLENLAALPVLLVHEILVGADPRRNRAASDLGVAGGRLGDRPAARAWLRHRGRSDPGPAGCRSSAIF